MQALNENETGNGEIICNIKRAVLNQNLHDESFMTVAVKFLLLIVSELEIGKHNASLWDRFNESCKAFKFGEQTVK